MKDEYDTHRAEDEGMFFHSEYHHNDEQLRKRDVDLEQFLNGIVDTFEKDKNIYDLRQSLLVTVSRLNKAEKDKLVDITKHHFVKETCELHDKKITVSHHAGLKQELAGENVDNFLANEGLESLKKHLKYVVPERWLNMLQEEAVRLSEYINEERYNSGTPG